MTNEDIVLTTLFNIQLQQEPDSHYWDVTGGTYYSEIAKACGLTEAQVDAAAHNLQQSGYVELIDRKDPAVSEMGVRCLKSGELQAKSIIAAKMAADKATADQEALVLAQQELLKQAIAVLAVLPTLPNYDQAVTDIINRAKALSLI